MRVRFFQRECKGRIALAPARVEFAQFAAEEVGRLEYVLIAAHYAMASNPHIADRSAKFSMHHDESNVGDLQRIELP